MASYRSFRCDDMSSDDRQFTDIMMSSIESPNINRELSIGQCFRSKTLLHPFVNWNSRHRAIHYHFRLCGNRLFISTLSYSFFPRFFIRSIWGGCDWGEGLTNKVLPNRRRYLSKKHSHWLASMPIICPSSIADRIENFSLALHKADDVQWRRAHYKLIISSVSVACTTIHELFVARPQQVNVNAIKYSVYFVAIKTLHEPISQLQRWPPPLLLMSIRNANK